MFLNYVSGDYSESVVMLSCTTGGVMSLCSTTCFIALSAALKMCLQVLYSSPFGICDCGHAGYMYILL